MARYSSCKPFAGRLQLLSRRILSGGQAGADRANLAVARRLGRPGRLADAAMMRAWLREWIEPDRIEIFGCPGR
jgi:hypothetical protein